MAVISHPARFCVVTPRPQQIRTGGNAQPFTPIPNPSVNHALTDTKLLRGREKLRM